MLMQTNMEGTEMTLINDSGDESEDEADDDERVEQMEPQFWSLFGWDLLGDIDVFFRRVYEFHQRDGLVCILLEDFFSIFQFIFVVCFSTFLLRCVNYGILFSSPTNRNVRYLSDAVYPLGQCIRNFTLVIYILLITAAIFLFISTVKMLYQFIKFREVSQFYSKALNIAQSELKNFTWNEILKRIIDASKEMHLCSSTKRQLDQFDVCSRILRRKNYFIGMINKEPFSLHHRIPFVGDYVFFPRQLLHSLEFLFFISPRSLFRTHCQLRMQVKQFTKRTESAQMLQRQILIVGLLSLLLSPILFVWEVFIIFFKYTALLKKQPNHFSIRRWSQYAHLFLRDYNELDHIFERRLNAAHESASTYMNMFISPFLIILAKNIVFIAGALLAALITLTVIDEDVINVEGVLQGIVSLTLIIGILSQIIPDENAVYDPKTTFYEILASIHYCPDDWKGNEHKKEVRDSFSNLFHMKMTYCLEELLSPFITPFILLFKIRPRSLQIIDFFRNYTKYLDGVGDVCSLYDITRHGDPRWAASDSDEMNVFGSNIENYGKFGKSEISLVNFSANYPEWRPSDETVDYLTNCEKNIDQSVAQASITESIFKQVMPCLHTGVGRNLKGGIARMSPLESVSRRDGARDDSKLMSFADDTETCSFAPLPRPPLNFQRDRPQMPSFKSTFVSCTDVANLRTLSLHEIHNRRIRNVNI